MERVHCFKMMLKNIILGYLFNLILLFFYAVILTYTSISEETIPITTALLGLICVFMSSFISLKAIKKNGLKNGALIGLLYSVLWFVTSSIFSKSFAYSGQTLVTMLLYMILGMVGGMIGVNLF